VFITPQKSDVIEMNIRYGKQILPRITANANFSLSSSNPDSNIFKNDGKNMITTMENGIKTSINILKTSDKTIFAEFCPSLFRILENRGKNAALKAPSANILLKTFDIRTAISRASEYIPAPRQKAIMHSRINPMILLKSVKEPTIKTFFTTLTKTPNYFRAFLQSNRLRKIFNLNWQTVKSNLENNQRDFSDVIFSSMHMDLLYHKQNKKATKM
jgi:hypothetical protein